MLFGNKFFSSISFRPASHLLRAIAELPAQEQNSLVVSIYPVFKEITLNSIQNKMQKSVTLQTVNPPRYTASIKELAQASHLVDVLLKINTPAALSQAEKVTLADVYAQYASVLYRYRPSETVLSEKTMLKSYELDPNNKTAQKLNIDMNYIVPRDSDELEFKTI